jgi:hypothetical protein
MIPAIIVIFLIVALVGIHMARPRFRPQKLSAARFFRDLPDSQRSNRRLALGNPLRSLPLYVQLSLLAVALMALLSHQTLVERKSKAIGLWVVMDTSASMSTKQGSDDRMTAGSEMVEAMMNHVRSLEVDGAVCAKLSAFDLELREVLPATYDLQQVVRSAESLEFRPLGTDLTLVQNLLQKEEQEATSPEGGSCDITHIVVISDQPAPYLAENTSPTLAEILWLDIDLPKPNSGITGLDFSRDPFTGRVSQVHINLEAYGEQAPAPTIQVLAPDGEAVLDESVTWSPGGRWQNEFTPHLAGLYTVQLLPEDAYAYDNHAAFTVTLGQELRVDWQLQDETLLRQLNWERATEDADFRVLSADSFTSDNIPTLLVGSGYQGEGQEEVLSFVENHPLLANLNLDVAERLGIQEMTLPDSFDVILLSTEGNVWIAERRDPPAVYVPGLPQGEDLVWSFSVTAFFNGVRRLMQANQSPPPYTLTSPQAPEPSVGHLVLHPGEGNTARPTVSLGSIDELRPGQPIVEHDPEWPLYLSIAALIFLFERTLFSLGGERWR